MTELRSVAPLPARYGPEDLDVFTAEERARFAPNDVIDDHTAWQLLYRLEPDLYERLIAGESIHPGVIEWLPSDLGRCVEVAAGGGRLTREIAGRCAELLAVEPAAPMRERLRRRFRDVDVRNGFFDQIPAPDGWADHVISCSAFRADPACGGERGLEEMDRVLSSGGVVILVWPCEVDWLKARGFEYASFDGEMYIEFPSLQEALALARVFYPDAVDAIAGRGSPHVPYELVGVRGPCDVAWKQKP